MGKSLSVTKKDWDDSDKDIQFRSVSRRHRRKHGSTKKLGKRNSVPPQPKEKSIKIVLFGTGEAGKTTNMRQMKITHGDPLKEKMLMRGNILVNVVEGVGLTLKAGQDLFGLSFKDNPDAMVVLEEFERISSVKDFNASNYMIDLKLVKAIKNVCKDCKEFNQILEHRNEYQMFDGWDYLKNKLITEFPEWGGPSWVPSFDDLIHSRIRTTGRVILDFTYDEMKYQLIDVGGQRVERRKFFAIFKEIDAMLFVAALSEYNQVLFENHLVNRLTESLNVWEKTVHHPNFANTWFLLLLNKMDLFKKKFRDDRIPIETTLDYDAPPLPEDDDDKCTKSKRWFEELYLSKVKPSKRQQVRVYFTSALDRKSISNVIQLCSSILKHNFAASNIV